MSKSNLPGRITLVMISTTLIFVITTVASILWVTSALDRQALTQSEIQVRVARSNLVEQARRQVVDYAKWDAAHAALRAGDIEWILDNIGSSAMIGHLMQLAIIRGGPFPEDRGWISGGGLEPRAGLLPEVMLEEVERRLRSHGPGAFDGIEFFAWVDGKLFVLGASKVEAVEDAAALPPGERIAGQLVLGIEVSDEVVVDIAHSILLSGAGIVRVRPEGRPSLALPGLDGAPVAFVAWDLPQPGTRLLRRMLPLLTPVLLVAAALAAMGARLAGRSAVTLVRAEHQASSAARTDALTGLPNRVAFNEVLARPARAGERAVLFLDLNGFKRINDSIGHAAGDLVIRGMADRLRTLVRADRHLSRIGGDEFVFVISDAEADFTVAELIGAVTALMRAPFEVQGHRLCLEAAMGYAVQVSDALSADDLVRQADLAMYEAKRNKAGAVAFGQMIAAAATDAVLIEQGLREVLARPPRRDGGEEEITLAYQPIVDPSTRRLARAEALARWTSPSLGRVAPDRFIPVAEQAGLIVDLGHRIFLKICDDLERHPDLRVSLNVSPVQLLAPTFVADMTAHLALRGIDPGRVEVELTEGIIVDDPKLAGQRLVELHAAGFSTALDDFGTGYSSIGYLEQMPFDVLKVDRSFVTGILSSASRLDLVHAMILLGHALGLRVVCEGVEEAAELALLRRLGCDLVQGYHLDRPLPMADLAARWLGAAAAPSGPPPREAKAQGS